MKIAFLYPGQGSQYVGMARDFYERYDFVKELYNKASAFMNKDIAGISFNGPEEVLKETDNTQLSIVLHSLSITEVLLRDKDLSIEPELMAGHSVGQYSALIASNVLSLQDGLNLLVKRANYMLQDCKKVKTSMTAVIGLPLEKIEHIISKYPDVEIANINTDSQIVIGGKIETLEEVEKVLKENSAKRVIRLNVFGAFHTQFMKDASDKLTKEIEKVIFKDAKYPIVDNVSANILKKSQDLKESLKKQIISKVKWRDSIITMLDAGIDTFIELGPGKVLSGMVKKMTRRMKNINVFNIDKIEDIDKIKSRISLV